jgi:ribosomal protein S8
MEKGHTSLIKIPKNIVLIKILNICYQYGYIKYLPLVSSNDIHLIKIGEQSKLKIVFMKVSNTKSTLTAQGVREMLSIDGIHFLNTTKGFISHIECVNYKIGGTLYATLSYCK